MSTSTQSSQDVSHSFSAPGIVLLHTSATVKAIIWTVMQKSGLPVYSRHLSVGEVQAEAPSQVLDWLATPKAWQPRSRHQFHGRHDAVCYASRLLRCMKDLKQVVYLCAQAALLHGCWLTQGACSYCNGGGAGKVNSCDHSPGTMRHDR
jgi:hypothetical protein